MTTSLTGRHQIQNLALCLGVIKSLGGSVELLEDVIKSLQLPGMRMKLTEIDGVQWINDAYNANPQSTAALLKWLDDIGGEFSGEKYVVLGDMLELGDESLFFHQQITGHIPVGWTVIAVGDFYSAAFKEKASCFADSVKAAEYLHGKLKNGDVVALKGSRGIRLEKIMEKEIK
ncbi:MAG: hypothetical protein HRT88_23545 [Lentisphaeraceae bacterium]|nr:hypothetical protein [Lentisphaeraceae bacterium]